MKETLSMYSGSFFLRGAVAVILGILAFALPGPTLAALIAVFAAYAIIDGVVAIAGGLRLSGTPRWWLILGGLAGVFVGAFTIFSPGTTALVLVLWIGILAIARGATEVASAITLRRVLDNALLFGLSGVVSIVFGIFLIVAPGEGALAVLWLIGYFAIFAGIMYLALGFRVRGIEKALEKIGRTAPA